MIIRNLKMTGLASAVCLLCACGGSNDGGKVLPTPEPVLPSAEPTPEPVPETAFPSSFYFGNDLSYVNEMEDCGAVYRDNGVAADPYEIMANHGTNLVRVRLWHDPWWISEVPQDDSVAASRKAKYSDLDDVAETVRRARAAEMDVMLGIHFSDVWTDPGQQIIPRAWANLWSDDQALADAVYEYVTNVLTRLESEGGIPEIIKLGNESNPGLMVHERLEVTKNADSTLNLEKAGETNTDEVRTAALWNSAIKAVRDFTAGRDNPPRIALHVANSHNAVDFMTKMMSIGVTDFDIIGFSYYYSWHGRSIPEMAGEIKKLRTQFPDYAPMLVETGYPWDDESIDSLANIIQDADPSYRPLSKQNQLKYMVDAVQAVADAGGIGVVFWEPAWVSTACRTPWGQGSSHEHVAYFDHRDNGNFHIGGTWMEANYMGEAPANGVETTFYLKAANMEASGGFHIRGDFTENTPQPMKFIGNGMYEYTTSIADGASGKYHFLQSAEVGSRETVPAACNNGAEYWADRTYSVSADSENEFAFEWASCEAFTPLTEVKVRFNANMSSVDNDNGAFITGDFNGWKIEPMTPMGNKIYSLEVVLAPGSESAFYLLNSPTDWEVRETLPSACALKFNKDRLLSVPTDKESEIYNITWGSCDSFEYDSPPIDENGLVTMTFKVDMTGQDVANGVYIGGTMNDWTVPLALTQVANSSIYELKFNVEPNSTHQFFFMKDVEWKEKETVPGECSNDNNRSYAVGEANNQEVLLAWSSCDENPAPTEVAVTFKVDMAGHDVSTGVYIGGSMNDWDVPLALAQVNDTSIYERKFMLEPNSTHKFYFMGDVGWSKKETVPGECSSNNDRSYTVGGATSQEVLLGWSSCDENPAAAP